VHVTTKLKIVRIRERRETNAKVLVIGTSQWMSSCQSREEKMLDVVVSDVLNISGEKR
jgi:hypothetical protein